MYTEKRIYDYGDGWLYEEHIHHGGSESFVVYESPALKELRRNRDKKENLTLEQKIKKHFDDL